MWALEINNAVAHLRDVLGDPVYELAAREGETRTTVANVYVASPSAGNDPEGRQRAG